MIDRHAWPSKNRAIKQRPSGRWVARREAQMGTGMRISGHLAVRLLQYQFLWYTATDNESSIIPLSKRFRYLAERNRTMD